MELCSYIYLEMCLFRKQGFCHMYKSGLIYSFAFHIYMPRFYAKSLTIAIVCGNYFRVFPRNLVYRFNYNSMHA